MNAALIQVHKGRMLGVVPVLAELCSDEEVPPLWDALHRYDATQSYEIARKGLLRALGLSVSHSLMGTLFYDRAAGQGEFYHVDAQGQMSYLQSYSDLRTTWDQIVPLPQSDLPTALLFYDRAAGDAELYKVDALGQMQTLRRYADFRKTWDLICGLEWANDR